MTGGEGGGLPAGGRGKKSLAPVMDPATAARAALRSLGKRGSALPGFFNKLGAPVLTRLLGRKARLRVMGAAMKSRRS